MPLFLQHHLVTPCIWLGITHPWNLAHYGLWVNCNFFMIYTCKHCFPPLLLVFVMKCYIFNCIGLCLVTPIFVRFLYLCSCFNCPSVRALTLHQLLAHHHHLCYVDLYCVYTRKQLFYTFFNLYDYLPFMYYFCKYFLSPCFSCILCLFLC